MRRLCGLILFLACVQLAGATPPNIVLIIADDQRWSDYGFMGHPQIQTPHLDQLARESVLFRRGYVPTAICRPSLMSIMTGLYPHQHLTCGNDPCAAGGWSGLTCLRNAAQ